MHVHVSVIVGFGKHQKVHENVDGEFLLEMLPNQTLGNDRDISVQQFWLKREVETGSRKEMGSPPSPPAWPPA